MDSREHIHIISAGDSINKTYPAVLRELPTITHTFIFAEKEVYTNSGRDDTQKRRWKCAIRDAIDDVNSRSLSQGISCGLVTIDSDSFDAIRDPVLGIFSDHPAARYSFDISAGSKRLSLGLFSMSLWVEGDAYYAFGNSPARRVPVPTLPVRNLPAHPHHLVILTILFRGLEHGKEERMLVPEVTLFNEAKAWQIPGHTADNGSTTTELSPVAFSRIVASLVRWNFIREETSSANGLEKFYCITPDGELALCICSARMRARGVASSPGLT